MEIIYLAIANYKDTKRISLCFSNIPVVNKCLRKVKGMRWSNTLKAWHMPCLQEAVQQLAKETEGFALLDTTALRQQLAALKHESEKTYISKSISNTAIAKKTGIKKGFAEVANITEQNRQALHKLTDQLKLKAYSASTIRTYKNEFGIFLQAIQQRTAESITADDLKRYLLYCLGELKLTENTVHSRLYALKFIMRRYWNVKSFF